MILKLSFDSKNSSDEVIDSLDDDILYATVGNINDLKSVVEKKGKSCERIVLDIIPDADRYRNMIDYLKDKAVILAPLYSLEEVIKYIQKNKLYDFEFLINGNSYKPINYDKLLKVNKYIDSIVDYINHFDLSLYEKTLFAADLIRELRYKKANDNNSYESFSISRDLYSLLEEDFIVCEGYANIYSAVLTKLGIKNSVLLYNPDKKDKDASGHAANLVILKDEKYKIDGIYTYDLTWVSNNNSDYLSNYNYLGLPIEYDALAKREKYSLSNEANMIKTSIQLIEERINRAETLINYSAPEKIIFQAFKLIEEGFKDCYKRYLKSKDIYKYEEYFNKYKEPLKGIKEYYNAIKDRCISEIPDKTFYNALYNVRRIESSIDKDKYDFSISKINTISDKRHAFITALRTKSGLKHALGIEKTDRQAFFDAVFNTCDHDEIEKIQKGLKKCVKIYTDKDTQLCTNITCEDGEPLYDEFDLDESRMNLLSVLRKVSNEDISNPVLKRKKYK